MKGGKAGNRAENYRYQTHCIRECYIRERYIRECRSIHFRPKNPHPKNLRRMPVRVDIKKSGNNKAAVRIERFAFAIRCTGIVASAQCSYCAVKLDTPRLQSAGEQQRGILDKKTFHYIKY